MILVYCLIGWAVTLIGMVWLSVKSGNAPGTIFAAVVLFAIWPVWLVVIAYTELMKRGPR